MFGVNVYDRSIFNTNESPMPRFEHTKFSINKLQFLFIYYIFVIYLKTNVEGPNEIIVKHCSA